MANYLSKRGANVAPSYATTDDLPASTEVGDLVFVDGQLGIAVSASGYQTCDKTDIDTSADWTATTQQAILQASDSDGGDKLGFSCSIDGDTLVVGAYNEDTGGTQAGAAYIFTRSGTSWSQQAKIQASDPDEYDNFGHSVAIDGDTVVVGTPWEGIGSGYQGAAYVFTRSGTSWSQQAKLTSSDIQASDSFGACVTIKGDTMVAGAYGEDTGGSLAGAVYIFTRSGTTWSQQAKIQSSDIAAGDQFGRYSLHLSSNTLVVGAHNENQTGSASMVLVQPICIYSFGYFMVSTSKISSIRCISRCALWPVGSDRR